MNLLLFISVILLVDGLLGNYAGTAGRGQVNGSRWASLQRQLTSKRQEYTSKGYCTSVAILSQDVGAVAIPILPAGSNDIYILACGMPAHDFYAERIERSIAPKMLKTARALTDALSR